MPKYLADIDLNKNQLSNARIQNLATSPSTPVVGQVYFDTVAACIMVCTVGGGSPTWVKAGALSALDLLTIINAGATILDFDNLPTGTGSTQVAIGNHVHDTIYLKRIADLTVTKTPAEMVTLAVDGYPYITHVNGSGYPAALGTILGFASSENTYLNSWQKWIGISGSEQIRWSTAAATWGAWQKVWDASNMGTGSGLDADKLDGNEAAAFSLSGHTHSAATPAAHNLVDLTGHPVSGLTTGHVLKASGAAAYGFAALANTDISGLGSAATKNTGTASGDIPLLTTGGLLPASMMPALAINDYTVVANLAGRLALTAQRGDMCYQTDTALTYVLATDTPGTDGDWKSVTATGVVTSVCGDVGAVTLNSADVGLGNVTNESKATMFTNPTFTGTVTGVTPAAANNTTLVATTAWCTTEYGARTKKYAVDMGNGALTSFTITHSLNNLDVMVMVKDNASPYALVYPDIEVATVNTVTVKFTIAPTSNQYRCVVIG
ncbi:MAG: hypothetical protein WCK39_00090 [Methanomassiliicoccales archaeon]